MTVQRGFVVWRKEWLLLLVSLSLSLLFRQAFACSNGKLVDGVCVCDHGWMGDMCDACTGRVRLNETSGFITDGTGKYRAFQACNWIIDTGRPNTTIWLSVEHLSLECIWDTLYIFDGDSVSSPLLASLSGYSSPMTDEVSTPFSPFVPGNNNQLIVAGGLPTEFNSTNRSPLQLRSSSGLMYIYFFADFGYHSSGFNLSYSIASCPGEPECSLNGVCDTALYRCSCSPGWTGSDCSVALCHERTCESNGGVCDVTTGECNCPEDRQGTNCVYSTGDPLWDTVSSVAMGDLNWLHQGRASHTMVVYDSLFYVYGGYAANIPSYYPFESLLVFDPTTSMWSVPAVNTSGDIPVNRYGHTAVVHEGNMIVFGGRIDGRGIPVNELWSLNLTSMPLEWQRLVPEGDVPVAVAMHTATVVNDSTMILLWGTGLADVVQQAIQYYDIATNRWMANVRPVNGYAHARHSHSAVYSAASRKMLVFGGSTARGRVRELLVYDPYFKEWSTTVLGGGPFSTLQSMVLGPSPTEGDLAVVVGGCHYNDSNSQRGSLCHSNELWIFDVGCREWLKLTIPDFGGRSSARFGHTAVSLNGSMWVFGGYDGTYRNDMLRFTYALCSLFTNRSVCLASSSLLNCVWENSTGQCLDANVAYNSSLEYQRSCRTAACPLAPTCSNCFEFDSCSYSTGLSCVAGISNATAANTCSRYPLATSQVAYLKRTRSCIECQQQGGFWNRGTCNNLNITRRRCDSEFCGKVTSCTSCVITSGCFWCPSLSSCIPTLGYATRFAYSECLRWADVFFPGGICPARRCSSYRNCSLCLNAPGCGWCEDDSRTGAGRCYSGTNSGPEVESDEWYNAPSAINQTAPQCPDTRWHYEKCPACQCNGRSVCNVENTCINCSNGFIGKNCEHCPPFTFAEAHLTNVTCRACQCNQHGTSCHNILGSCSCLNFGTRGNNCDRCKPYFYGNATNGGLCYERVYVTALEVKVSDGPFLNNRIQFYCSPATDRTVKFRLSTSVPVKFNMTIEYSNVQGQESALAHFASTDSVSYTFLKTNFEFDGIDRIYVRLSNLPPDDKINVTLVFQYEDSIDIIIVFATFFGCFLAFILLLMVLWYIRQYITTVLNRRNRARELVLMSKRPYGSLKLRMDHTTPSHDEFLMNFLVWLTIIDTSATGFIPASPLTVQPLAQNERIAICTFAMKLPGTPAASSSSSHQRFVAASAILSIKKQTQFRHKPRRQGVIMENLRFRNGSSVQLLDDV